MSDPLIVCPKCRTPIKLTDSLAAPLIAKTRRQFEQQLAQKDADFAKREVSLRKSQKALAKAREAIDDEVAKRLQIERVSITESEKKKARVALAADLKQRDRVLAELQGNLDANNAKLAEAQQAHADVLRKSRELDDAKRELDLSVQKKVQESLAAVRDQLHHHLPVQPDIHACGIIAVTGVTEFLRKLLACTEAGVDIERLHQIDDRGAPFQLFALGGNGLVQNGRDID